MQLLPDASPVFAKVRSASIRLRDDVKSKVKQLVDTGRNTQVFKSDWASPTVNALKSQGMIRVCGNFSSTVNKFLDLVKYPLPTIDDVISQIGNARVFTKIVLSTAFLQVSLDEQSKQYTTIVKEGLYHFTYLPFGLTASPGLFQSYICKILNNIEQTVIYQDDILILTSDVNSHNVVLRKVLTALQNLGIKLNNDKCSFFTNNVNLSRLCIR